MFKLYRLLLASISFLIILFNSSISAKVSCTGVVCSAIPAQYLNQFNQLDTAFKTQYLDEVTKSMLDASIMSNISSGMIGPGVINRFQVGVGAGLGAVQKQDITVKYGDMQFPKLPNAGAMLSPNAMIGFNLGWILFQGEANSPTRTFLHRFNIYLHGAQMDYKAEDVKQLQNQKGLSGNFGFNNKGVSVRFTLVKERYTSFKIFGFTGISLGAGYHTENSDVHLTYKDQKVPQVKMGTMTLGWDGTTQFDFKNRIKTATFDIRTGVRLFYFFTIFCGVGSSNTDASMDVTLQRSGEIKVNGIESTLSQQIPDAYKNYINVNQIASSLNTGSLTVSLNGQSHYKHLRKDYAVAGFEFNVFMVKVLAEATFAKDQLYGANVGIKMAF